METSAQYEQSSHPRLLHERIGTYQSRDDSILLFSLIPRPSALLLMLRLTLAGNTPVGLPLGGYFYMPYPFSTPS